MLVVQCPGHHVSLVGEEFHEQLVCIRRPARRAHPGNRNGSSAACPSAAAAMSPAPAPTSSSDAFHATCRVQLPLPDGLSPRRIQAGGGSQAGADNRQRACWGPRGSCQGFKDESVLAGYTAVPTGCPKARQSRAPPPARWAPASGQLAPVHTTCLSNPGGERVLPSLHHVHQDGRLPPSCRSTSVSAGHRALASGLRLRRTLCQPGASHQAPTACLGRSQASGRAYVTMAESVCCQEVSRAPKQLLHKAPTARQGRGDLLAWKSWQPHHQAPTARAVGSWKSL